ncbi:MAG: hypothetical protein ACO1N5_02935 [Noviherbaspirillum sp.]
MDSRRMAALAAGLGLAALLAGCQDRQQSAAADGVAATKFPGAITAGGGTSGEVMARAKAGDEESNVSGTPGIPAGAGGNTGGVATGGTTQQSGNGPGAAGNK